jgi:hypothetical protein
MKLRAFLLPAALTALSASVTLSGCSSNQDHAERNGAPEAQGKHPDYSVMTDDELKAVCVGACNPDPGSRAVDVAKLETGYEFAWVWNLAGENFAKYTYTYDDNTTRFVVPKTILSSVADALGGWEPTADNVATDRPGPKLAARFKGGPFTEYGGGFGQSFRTISNLDSRNPLLAKTPSAEFPGSPMDGAGGAYDLRGWTGIAIWVRRGPDGQSTMRVGITERNSAEDLNSSAITDFYQHLRQETIPGIQEGKYCRRWRICGCSGGTPCSKIGDDYRCYDPALGPAPDMNDPEFRWKYPACDATRCEQGNTSTGDPSSAPGSAGTYDPLFQHKSCSLALESDGRSDSFCYDPGKDPTPPAKRERCNNPFSFPITVTTDWQLIKVPFSQLRQADEANVASDMDLESVKQIVVTYGGGWTDFYVANLGFYRAQ